jgi:predicted nucleic acid-binding protein
VTVVDTSALLDLLLDAPAAAALEARLFVEGQMLHAPHLIDAEVANTLRRLVAAGKIAPELGRIALADLVDLPLQRHPHDWLLPRVWELRQNFSAYDALYVALAEALDAPLVTRDQRLAAAPGHQARIEVM